MQGMAVGAGASFYPFSGGTFNEGNGDLDKIANTADKDLAIGMLGMHATYGNAFMPFMMEPNS